MTTFVPLSKKEDVLPVQARNNLAHIKYLGTLEEEAEKGLMTVKDCEGKDVSRKNSTCDDLRAIKRQKLELAISTYSLLENEVNSLERGIAELQSLLDEDDNESSDESDDELFFGVCNVNQIQDEKKISETIHISMDSSAPAQISKTKSNAIEDDNDHY